MHVLPDAQTVQPVHDVPPHCAYFAAVHVELADAAALELVVVVVVVDVLEEVVIVARVVLLPLLTPAEDDELEPVDPTKHVSVAQRNQRHRKTTTTTQSSVGRHDSPPGPETLVERLPLSTYTPEKNRSSSASAYPSRGSSSTPRCQSAPLELVLALTGPTSWVRASAPVECQKATVLAVKSISFLRLVSQLTIFFFFFGCPVFKVIQDD